MATATRSRLRGLIFSEPTLSNENRKKADNFLRKLTANQVKLLNVRRSDGRPIQTKIGRQLIQNVSVPNKIRFSKDITNSNDRAILRKLHVLTDDEIKKLNLRKGKNYYKEANLQYMQNKPNWYTRGIPKKFLWFIPIGYNKINRNKKILLREYLKTKSLLSARSVKAKTIQVATRGVRKLAKTERLKKLGKWLLGKGVSYVDETYGVKRGLKDLATTAVAIGATALLAKKMKGRNEAARAKTVSQSRARV